MARVVTGLFGRVISSVLLAIVADDFSPQQRGRAVSLVLSIPIGLLLATHWNWHAPFLLLVGLALLSSVAIARGMQPVTKHLTPQAKASALQHFWHTLRTKNYQTGFLATVSL